MAEPTIIEEYKYFYDDVKIIEKCTFSGYWLQKFEEPAAKEELQIE
jgi:hypothetical protein